MSYFGFEHLPNCLLGAEAFLKLEQNLKIVMRLAFPFLKIKINKLLLKASINCKQIFELCCEVMKVT